MKQVTVDLQERSYPIYLGREILSTFAECYESHNLPQQLAIVTDKHVAPLYLRHLGNSLRHTGHDIIEIVIGTGERQKSLSCANFIFTKFLTARLPRDSAVIALGGGVVGDVTGFTAATYRRGVKLVHVPTTLLAQVESAIGGKTAINHPNGKNAIGAFYQPKFVLSDVALLSTLPKREIFCGLGEVVKYAILDEQFCSLLEQYLENIIRLDLDVLQDIVLHCNILKAAMVSADERETNASRGRAVLNLGHTIGHALEHHSRYKLHHGEAVLIGLRWELHIARDAGIISKDGFERIHSILQRIQFKPNWTFFNKTTFMKQLFGKNKKVKFVLPKKVGEILITNDIDPRLVLAAMKNTKKLT